MRFLALCLLNSCLFWEPIRSFKEPIDDTIEDAQPTCTDEIMNGEETGTDCGGGCAACPVEPPDDDLSRMTVDGLRHGEARAASPRLFISPGRLALSVAKLRCRKEGRVDRG